MIQLIFWNIFLIIVLIFVYNIFNRELLSPTFICIAMYLLSSFMLLFYVDTWKFDLTLKTVAVVSIGLVSVFLGELAGTKVRIGLHFGKDISNESDKPIIIKKTALYLCFFFVSLTAILYLREIRNIAANSSFGEMYSFMMTVRRTKADDGVNVSYYVQQMFTLSEAIVCVLTYILLNNRLKYGEKKETKIIIMTMIVYIANTFMTTGRAKMLNFFIYILCCWIIIYAQKRNWTFRGNIKLFGKIILISGVAISLFYFAGFLTEKSLHYDNFFDNFANYFSSSLYALNEYLKNPGNFRSGTSFFGSYTLSGICSLLRTIGINVPANNIVLEYIQCGKYVTNIYTPLRRYIQDFGILGEAFIMFFMGYGYKRLLWKNKNASGFFCIMTSYFYFPLFFIAIEERLFMDVVMIRSLYTIIYLYIIYMWLVKGKFLFWKIKSLN